ncbi:hypothetical protein D3C87_1993900 [compost metagenome]
MPRISATISNTAINTPPTLNRRLSPPGSPNNATATVDSPMANTRKITAIISVLRRVCCR